MNSLTQVFSVTYFKFRNLILYGIIGTFSASLDFVAFYTLTTVLGVYYLAANILSVTIGITISFILNRKYNFKVKDNTIIRFIIFISVGFGGLLLSSLLLYLFVEILSIEKIISKFLSIVFVVLMQFFMNKFLTFRKNLI